MTKIRALAISFAAAALSFRCAAPAASVRSAAMPAPPTAAEEKLGRDLAARLFARDPLVSDERLLLYVNLVGRAVSSPSLHFAVTQSDIPYTLWLPGGIVVVSRGAVALMASEAELAVVLSREIGRGFPSAGTAGEPRGGADAEAAREEQADVSGARLASAAGYDAQAFLHYLDALKLRADSAREKWDLQVRIDNYRRLPEMSAGGKTVADRFKRSAVS